MPWPVHWERSVSNCLIAVPWSMGTRTSEPWTYVFAEKSLASPAVKAVAAQLRVVCRDAVSNLERGHLGTNSRDDADSFMARDQRELGDKLAFVDVLVVPC